MALSDWLMALVAIASFAYLFREVFYRLWMRYDDDVKTIIAMPLQNRPPANKITLLHEVDRDLVLEHGPLLRFINPLKPWDHGLLIADPLLLREMFVGKDWELWDRRHENFSPHDAYTTGLITLANGPKWRATRALFDRTFTTVAVRRYTPVLLDLRNVLMQQLVKANEANPKGFDIFPLFHRFTFDTITRLTFGAEVNAQTTEEGARMSKAFDRWLECGALLSTLKIMFGGWSQILVPGVVKDQKASHEMMFGLVAKEHERIKRGIERVSIMDDTIKAAEAEGFDEEHTHAALMSILFAGHDTTAALLAFVTYELSKRPDLQEEIRREVEEANGPGDLVNLEVLEKCKVLNACIKESLRMRPSAPYGAGRTAFKDFECVYTDAFGQVKKVQVQKGDQIFPAIHAMHNYPPYWDKDVDRFIPERWYDDPNGHSKAGLWSNAPFGNGARRCVGERLALGEGRLATASILRKFEIVHVPEGPDTWKFVTEFAGTIKPNMVMVQLRPRATK